MDLDQLLKNMKQLTPERMERLLLTFVKANENALIDFNTRQLLEGKDSFDKAIDPIYASAGYAEMKLHLNPRGVVDLKLTGEFHNSIFIDANQYPIIFKSSDSKADELLAKYGEEVLGVTGKDLQTFVHGYVLPDLQNAINNLIQLR